MMITLIALHATNFVEWLVATGLLSLVVLRAGVPFCLVCLSRVAIAARRWHVRFGSKEDAAAAITVPRSTPQGGGREAIARADVLFHRLMTQALFASVMTHIVGFGSLCNLLGGPTTIAPATGGIHHHVVERFHLQAALCLCLSVGHFSEWMLSSAILAGLRSDSSNDQQRPMDHQQSPPPLPASSSSLPSGNGDGDGQVASAVASEKWAAGMPNVPVRAAARNRIATDRINDEEEGKRPRRYSVAATLLGEQLQHSAIALAFAVLTVVVFAVPNVVGVVMPAGNRTSSEACPPNSRDLRCMHENHRATRLILHHFALGQWSTVAASRLHGLSSNDDDDTCVASTTAADAACARPRPAPLASHAAALTPSKGVPREHDEDRQWRPRLATAAKGTTTSDDDDDEDGSSRTMMGGTHVIFTSGDLHVTAMRYLKGVLRVTQLEHRRVAPPHSHEADREGRHRPTRPSSCSSSTKEGEEEISDTVSYRPMRLPPILMHIDRQLTAYHFYRRHLAALSPGLNLSRWCPEGAAGVVGIPPETKRAERQETSSRPLPNMPIGPPFSASWLLHRITAWLRRGWLTATVTTNSLLYDGMESAAAAEMTLDGRDRWPSVDDGQLAPCTATNLWDAIRSSEHQQQQLTGDGEDDNKSKVQQSNAAMEQLAENVAVSKKRRRSTRGSTKLWIQETSDISADKATWTAKGLVTTNAGWLHRLVAVAADITGNIIDVVSSSSRSASGIPFHAQEASDETPSFSDRVIARHESAQLAVHHLDRLLDFRRHGGEGEFLGSATSFARCARGSLVDHVASVLDMPLYLPIRERVVNETLRTFALATSFRRQAAPSQTEEDSAIRAWLATSALPWEAHPPGGLMPWSTTTPPSLFRLHWHDRRHLPTTTTAVIPTAADRLFGTVNLQVPWQAPEPLPSMVAWEGLSVAQWLLSRRAVLLGIAADVQRCGVKTKARRSSLKKRKTVPSSSSSLSKSLTLSYRAIRVRIETELDPQRWTRAPLPYSAAVAVQRQCGSQGEGRTSRLATGGGADGGGRTSLFFHDLMCPFVQLLDHVSAEKNDGH